MGDYPHARRGLGQRPDRLIPVHRLFTLAETAPQVDYRYVDAADVPDQADTLTAGLALVDLEVVGQDLAHAQPHQRVGANHKALLALARDPSILYPVKSAS